MSLEVDIRLRLGDFELDVAFENAGEPLGLLGASGSGKSVTLKCLAGLLRPDGGHVVLNGRRLFDAARAVNLRPQQREVAYLFQNYALFPHWSVSQNILCAARGSRAERLALLSDLLRRFHLEELAELRPHQLSGGQQQRVALARILASRPRLLLLDEPLAALDFNLQEEMRDSLLDLLREESLRRQMLTLLVTHDFSEVYQLSRQLLVMEQGKILIKGGTREIFTQPQRPEVARLTGCQNIIRAKKIGENRLLLPDWGLELESALVLPANLSHVGLRAGDFVPVERGDARPNQFRIRELRRVEKPFSLAVSCLPEGANDKAPPLLWESGRAKDSERSVSALYIAPDLILPLAEA